MSPSSSNANANAMPTHTDQRFVQLEQRLCKGEERMDKYDQILAQIVRTQDRHDLMLSTFIDEMKALKEKDIDISEMVKNHESDIHKLTDHWTTAIGIGKWILGILVSIGLLFLGSYISHIVK